MGAKGVGELGDKGEGLFYSQPTPAYGMHIDDPRMKPLLEKCAELHMPVSVHVADPMWMYQPMDSTNDGLMNAYKWRIDLTKKGILNHEQLIHTLKNAVEENPKTTFIACHLANCEYDLSILGTMFDIFPNLYADIGARFDEIATIPKYVHAFCEKYQNRLVYGTDMGYDLSMYRNTFRVLETADEHFYLYYGYHWPVYGLALSDTVLKKIYRDNALKITEQ
jgi:predicted TIM-barrel fold metal-dependent hydrolase